MKTFDVYYHPIKGYQAVKHGFGWPAFFFGVLWALVKRMWLVALLLFFAVLAFAGVEAVLEQSGNNGGYLLALAGELGLYVLTGVKGNDWRRSYLVSRGYKILDSVEAPSPDAAISFVVGRGATSAQRA